uniref:Zinc finger protein n=1 Tax=Solanum tuberosum TaxID=4113 RepID=M0ZMQ2_SOLTU
MGALCAGHSRDTLDRFSDRCLHVSPCLSDPARRSTCCLRIALVMLHLIYLGVLFVFDKDLIHKTKEEPWYLPLLYLLGKKLSLFFFRISRSQVFTYEEIDDGRAKLKIQCKQ